MKKSRPLPNPFPTGRQFPPEIIQLILDASLDPYDLFGVFLYPTFRYATLKTYPLINSTWRGVTKPALYEWVVLHTQRAADHFISTARKEGGTIRSVMSMEIARTVDEDIRPGVVLNCVPYLKVLSLATKEVNMQDLAKLHNLIRLSLSANVRPFPKHLCIPRLKFLRLHLAGNDQPDHLLTSRALPALRELSSLGWEGPVDVTLIQQLYALETQSPYILRLIPYATSLRLLSFPPILETVPPVKHLARFLLLQQIHPISIHGSLRCQLQHPNPGVRSIYINDLVMDSTLKAALAGLVRILEARGVNVVTGDLPFHWVCRRVEAILAKEYQAATARARAEKE